jgi:gluconokinase
MPTPPVIVLMGVSGSGKSTVGTLLAEHLGCPYAEADDFHPAANIDKMTAGLALDDADRIPWLDAIGRWLDDRLADGAPGVVTCSALKRAYRDQLQGGRPGVRLVLLHGSPELLAERLAARQGHFMKGTMLAGQLAALEPPVPEEQVITVDVTPPPAQIVAAIAAALTGPARTSRR